MNDIKKAVETLISASITGTKKQLPDNLDYEELYKQLKRHGVLTIGYDGLVRCGADKNHPIMQRLFKDYIKMMMYSEKQLKAKDKLLAAFEENGIEHLPLKGCNLKNLYPKPELRQMGDADILIKAEKYPEIEKILSEQGFETTPGAQHTRNWKTNDLYVEMHHQLMPDEDSDYLDYFGDGWSKAIHKNGSLYEYKPEDELIFIFVHYAKHFRIGGIGYRQLMDIWVYTNHYKQLDYSYIKAELAKMQLDEFFDNTLATAKVCFEDEAETDITQLISRFVFSSGNWGSLNSNILSSAVRGKATGTMGGMGAKKYAFFRLLFPPLVSLKVKYTFLDKKPWLLPLVWVIRWFDVLINRRHNISKKMRRSNEVSEEKVLQHQKFFDVIGLSYNIE